MFFEAVSECCDVFDRLKGIESLNHALLTLLSNALAGVAIYTCFKLYVLKVPAVELTKAQQRFSLATIHFFYNSNRYRCRRNNDSAQLTGVSVAATHL